MGGGAYGEGIPLHVGQETLLHQLRLLEPHEAVHLEQLVDLREGGGEEERERGGEGGEGRRGRRGGGGGGGSRGRRERGGKRGRRGRRGRDEKQVISILRFVPML